MGGWLEYTAKRRQGQGLASPGGGRMEKKAIIAGKPAHQGHDEAKPVVLDEIGERLVQPIGGLLSSQDDEFPGLNERSGPQTVKIDSARKMVGAQRHRLPPGMLVFIDEPQDFPPQQVNNCQSNVG